jgi:hypothetical protein
MMLALCRFNTGSAAFETAIGFIRENAQAEFCLTLSIFPPHPPWTAPRENLERFAGKTEYPTHYAMVNRVDQTAGRVLAELDRLRLREHTIVDPDYFGAWIFAPILEKAGLKIRFHDLRHFFASMLVAQGESAKYICDQMGHSSIQVTFDIYGHLFPKSRREAADKLQAAMPEGKTKANGSSLVAGGNKTNQKRLIDRKRKVAGDD